MKYCKHNMQQSKQTKKQEELEGKYSLESTDPRESEIRAHLRPQLSVE